MKVKTAYLGVFTALAIIFGYIEMLVPFHIGVPGVKLGIANIITVVLLYKTGIKEAGFVTIVRVCVSGFLFSNAFSILYSLAGCLLSLSIMGYLKKKDYFSIVGISMTGAIAHNLGQIAMASVIMETVSIWYYLPVLLISGVITGWAIGIISNEILERIKPIKLPE